MKNRPHISDEEIHSMMNFDKVLQQHKIVKKPKYTSTIIGSCVIVALLASWWLSRSSEEKAPIIQQPLIVPQQQKLVAQEQQKQKEVKSLKPVEVEKKKKPEPEVISTSAPILTEAEPIAGYDNLYSYFEKELTYPSDVKETIEGVVNVTFIINRNGKPEQIQIENSLGASFDNEIIRVIHGMPSWKPATQNGKAIPVKISQSFTFDINKSSQP